MSTSIAFPQYTSVAARSSDQRPARSITRYATRALIGMMQAVVDAAIWIVIYVPPLVGLLMLMAFVMWRGGLQPAEPREHREG